MTEPKMNKKPEKKRLSKDKNRIYSQQEMREIKIHNQVINDYEKFLPNKKELLKIAKETLYALNCNHYIINYGEDVAQAISKRIGK